MAMTLEDRLELLLTAAVLERAHTLRKARLDKDGPELTPPVHSFMPVAITEMKDWREQVMERFRRT